MARESKESVREKILAAAEKRLWHYGIKKTTIDEIAADADVGKGTVYLHFESKEEIAMAIMTGFKQKIILQEEQIARETCIPLLDRLKKVLSLPIANAHENCTKSPMIMEMVTAIRPLFPQRTRLLTEKEIEIVQGLLEEGNETGLMHVADPAETARILKRITHNYMPASHGIELVDDPIREIEHFIDLMYQGLK